MQDKNTPKKDNPSKSEFVKRFRENPFVFIGTLIVLVIVIIAFVLVPAIVPSAAGAPSADKFTFGYWNKKPIAYTGGGYFASMREQFSRYAQYYGLSSDYEIWHQAFRAAVYRTAVLDIMNKSNYMPPAAMIDKKVAALPQFQENGRFSSIKFNQVDKATRLSLWQDVNNETILNRYRDDVTGLAVSSKESEFIGTMAKKQRNFKSTAFFYETYPQEEIIEFVQKNGDIFKVLNLFQITMNSSESDAKKIRDSIDSKETTFDDAARAHSQDSFAERGGEAGVRHAFEINTLLANDDDRAAIIKLESGAVSPVYKSGSGWIFFSAQENPRDADVKQDASIDKFRSYIMEYERGMVEDWLLARAEEFIERANAVGFESAAAFRNLEVNSFGPVPVNYGDSSLFSMVSSFGTPYLRGAGTSENFWKTAFSTKIKTPSAPIVLSGGGRDAIVVLYPEEELTDETSASNTQAMFKSWVEQDASRSTENAIFGSSKFKDNFLTTYFALFSSGGF
ncbi:hypothetical protein FACS189494_10800 [Spirochaetia bacterium]|nr:hypothetical protein FACS189494_10800 [Spirochaetia bacterium]